MSNFANDAAKRILIVDDDPDLAEVVGEVLMGAGYRTAIAENGARALDRLRRETGWDLVLLDLMMPVMNGWEFRAAQLSEPALAAIPVVAFSGGAQVETAAVELRAAGWLRKPVSREELLALVHGLCFANDSDVK